MSVVNTTSFIPQTDFNARCNRIVCVVFAALPHSIRECRSRFDLRTRFFARKTGFKIPSLSLLRPSSFSTDRSNKVLLLQFFGGYIYDVCILIIFSSCLLPVSREDCAL